jgi:hypothetical protein
VDGEGEGRELSSMVTGAYIVDTVLDRTATSSVEIHGSVME